MLCLTCCSSSSQRHLTQNQRPHLSLEARLPSASMLHNSISIQQQEQQEPFPLLQAKRHWEKISFLLSLIRDLCLLYTHPLQQWLCADLVSTTGSAERRSQLLLAFPPLCANQAAGEVSGEGRRKRPWEAREGEK